MKIYRLVLLLIIMSFTLLSSISSGDEAIRRNLIAHGDFHGDIVNNLSEGWIAGAVRPVLAPTFRVVEKRGHRYLYMTGNKNPDCIGWVTTPVEITGGKTYWFRVRFRKSETLNPLHHLRFEVGTRAASQEIIEFHRMKNDWIEGETRIQFPGERTITADVRIIYRLCSKGEAWIQNISLVETEPIQPRWVRVACTQGPGSLEEYNLEYFSRGLDVAGQNKVDLMLLPEYFNGEIVTETMSGPSVKVMSEKARQYKMYVAGTIGIYDETKERLHNAALLFDREGNLIGRYDKIHLYGPELDQEGVTPGDKVPVFSTDFGKVGFMICSDSWFSDVAELVALQGADILLFPNLGYDRDLMHTRALDNLINIVTSSRSGRYGVWDASGRDVMSTPTVTGTFPAFKDVIIQKEGTLGILMVTLNLNYGISGGRRLPVARSRRHLGNQRIWLEDKILEEKLRWWVDEAPAENPE